MDPDKTLVQLRELIRRIDGSTVADALDDAAEVADLFLALDEWLSRGGFLPRDWDHA